MERDTSFPRDAVADGTASVDDDVVDKYTNTHSPSSAHQDPHHLLPFGKMKNFQIYQYIPSSSCVPCERWRKEGLEDGGGGGAGSPLHLDDSPERGEEL